MRDLWERVWWQWYKWRTRHVIDWNAKVDEKRTRELAEKLGWDRRPPTEEERDAH